MDLVTFFAEASLSRVSVHPAVAPAPTRPGRAPLPPAGSVDPAAPALVSADGVLTHGELRRRVEERADALPPVSGGRLLVQVSVRPRPDDVVAYLAVLEAGHVVLLVPEGDRGLGATWEPDLVLGAGGQVEEPPRTDLAPAPRHLLHPELALLLSTSGSTGSPKLVRLSGDGLLANARAIGQALGLTAADRGVTSLPLHYCFGLSVLHSHLLAGAAVALTGASVLDDEFWSCVDAGVSTLALVPHQVDLLERSGRLRRRHPSLRLLTQAGGRLSPDQVTRLAGLGRDHGFGLAVMYGQTEATARICVHDPREVAGAPDAVGRPVPGTTVVLDRTVPEASGDGVGEVVVRGPGVMLGYAESPEDLALGRMVEELRTGDLGRVDASGLLRIVGRRSGFVKILGLRIDLARVEQALEAEGLDACVTGDDESLRVAVEPAGGVPAEQLAARARRVAADASGVGVGHVRVAVLPLPRLANGKVDRPGCDVLVRGGDPDECADTRQRVDAPSLPVRVAEVLGGVLGRDEVDLQQSFVQLGGDSLSHVLASTRLTALLGELPRGWQHRPLTELVAAAQLVEPERGPTDGGDDGGGQPGGRRRFRRLRTPRPAGEGRTRGGHGARVPLETSVVLRAVAVVIICGSHADLFRVLGGAHTLLVVAGLSAATFGLSAPGVAARWRGTARLLVGIAVPTMAVALLGLSYGRYGWDNVVLANWLVGDIAYGKHNELWFVDALVACLLLTTAVLSLPPVARAWRTDPWRVAFGLLLVALVPRFLVLSLADGVLRGMMPTVFWLFAVGLALAHADTPARRWWTLGAMTLGVAWFFPDDPVRNATILAGVLLLALVPTLRVPARLVPVLTVLAAASLHIYLIQFQILGWVPTPLLATVAALAAGVLLWRLSDAPVRRLQRLLDPRHTPSATRAEPATPVPSAPSPERTRP